MRRSIDNGLLPPAVTQQDMDKRVNVIERSLSHRRHSDVVESNKSDASSVIPTPLKQSSSLLPTGGGGRATSTPLPPGPAPHPGPAWDISSLLSSQTGNTGGTGQDTGLGSLMYSMTTDGGHTHTADKQSYRLSMSSDSTRTSSTTHLNLSR